MRSRPSHFSTPADCAASRLAIRQGSHSFYLASRFLPVAIREPSYGVYAFCRMADDRIDREAGGHEAVSELHALLDRVYAGRPGDSFVERAFADAVTLHGIPRAIPAALVEGLSWDAEGRRYDTIADLESYAARVASAVGVMMTLVMNRRDPQVLARACDLGLAMQLTNIARDVGEDARDGRLYLPRDWLAEEGVDADLFLSSPAMTDGLRRVVSRLLERAEALYDAALPGIAELPGSCRSGIAAARTLYREIGREVARGADPVAARTVVAGRRKLALLSELFATRPEATGSLGAPPVPAIRFLVDAVRDAGEVDRPADLPPWWDAPGRAVRMVELLTQFGSARVFRRPLLSGDGTAR